MMNQEKIEACIQDLIAKGEQAAADNLSLVLKENKKLVKLLRDFDAYSSTDINYLTSPFERKVCDKLNSYS